jgi:hypothetical protein
MAGGAIPRRKKTMTDQQTNLKSDRKELEEKLFEATDEYEIEVIFGALQQMIVFWMSQICCDCRKKVAQKFKRDVPAMLAEADDFAAEHPDSVPDHHHQH